MNMNMNMNTAPLIFFFMTQNPEFLNSQGRYRYLIGQLLLPRSESTQKLLIFEGLELQPPLSHTASHIVSHTAPFGSYRGPYSSLSAIP